jgi:hypothetical protein
MKGCLEMEEFEPGYKFEVNDKVKVFASVYIDIFNQLRHAANTFMKLLREREQEFHGQMVKIYPELKNFHYKYDSRKEEIIIIRELYEGERQDIL